MARSWRGGLLIVLVGVYGGYFGAGVGVILLAVLAVRTVEPLAVTNAVKNVASGVCNLVAAVAYVFLAPVDWPSVLALGAGALIGGWIGPAGRAGAARAAAAVRDRRRRPRARGVPRHGVGPLTRGAASGSMNKHYPSSPDATRPEVQP